MTVINNAIDGRKLENIRSVLVTFHAVSRDPVIRAHNSNTGNCSPWIVGSISGQTSPVLEGSERTRRSNNGGCARIVSFELVGDYAGIRYSIQLIVEYSL